MSKLTDETLSVPTQKRDQMVDVTDRVARFVRDNVTDGFVIVYVPHTTAGVTIQENADPDVRHDLLAKLSTLVPKDEPYYRHAEGNSDSHVKTAMVGNSVQVLVTGGQLILGQWQGVYLCEFDGPRDRKVIVRAFDLAIERSTG
jgi:secondary thiamine-phosphate synthase enzyme